jgi:hypothetical protein
MKLKQINLLFVKEQNYQKKYTKDLSVSISSIIIGQIVMAFLVELGFRSYLQHIVETKSSS